MRHESCFISRIFQWFLYTGICLFTIFLSFLRYSLSFPLFFFRGATYSIYRHIPFPEIRLLRSFPCVPKFPCPPPIHSLLLTVVLCPLVPAVWVWVEPGHAEHAVQGGAGVHQEVEGQPRQISPIIIVKVHFFAIHLYSLFILIFLTTILNIPSCVVDPDPYWIRIQKHSGSRSTQVNIG